MTKLVNYDYVCQILSGLNDSEYKKDQSGDITLNLKSPEDTVFTIKISRVLYSHNEYAWSIGTTLKEVLTLVDEYRNKSLKLKKNNNVFLNYLEKYIKQYGNHNGYGGLEDDKIAKGGFGLKKELTRTKLKLNRNLWVLFHTTDLLSMKGIEVIKKEIESIKSNPSVYEGRFKKTIDFISNEINLSAEKIKYQEEKIPEIPLSSSNSLPITTQVSTTLSKTSDQEYAVLSKSAAIVLLNQCRLPETLKNIKTALNRTYKGLEVSGVNDSESSYFCIFPKNKEYIKIFRSKIEEIDYKLSKIKSDNIYFLQTMISYLLENNKLLSNYQKLYDDYQLIFSAFNQDLSTKENKNKFKLYIERITYDENFKKIPGLEEMINEIYENFSIKFPEKDITGIPDLKSLGKQNTSIEPSSSYASLSSTSISFSFFNSQVGISSSSSTAMSNSTPGSSTSSHFRESQPSPSSEPQCI